MTMGPEQDRRAIEKFPAGVELLRILDKSTLTKDKVDSLLTTTARLVHEAAAGITAKLEPIDPSTARCIVPDLTFSTPRGKFSLALLEDQLALLGKSEIRIPLTAIKQVAILDRFPKDTKDRVVIVIALDKAAGVKSGKSVLDCIVLQVLADTEAKVEVVGEEPLEGPLPVVICMLLGKAGVDETAFVSPDDDVYLSAAGSPAISATIKASQGFLYPLQNALYFVEKPALAMPHEDVASYELQRTESGLTTFELVLRFKDPKTPKVEFNIGKPELGRLQTYLERSSLTVFGSAPAPSKAKAGASKAAAVQDDGDDDEDEEEDDEDFNPEASDDSGRRGRPAKRQQRGAGSSGGVVDGAGPSSSSRVETEGAAEDEDEGSSSDEDSDDGGSDGGGEGGSSDGSDDDDSDDDGADFSDEEGIPASAIKGFMDSDRKAPRGRQLINQVKRWLRVVAARKRKAAQSMGPLAGAKKRGGGAGKSKGKSKNTGIGVDFKRVKHKVGKKLAKARNETNVSFKAASINLPSQAMQQDKEGVAVNFQNLSLQELLNQTSHYSEKTRKGALSGLSDLFARHPDEARTHTHALLAALAERACDGDAGVRQALRALLRERVLPALPPGAVRPFMPVLMANLSSAMTNLNMEVRLDALNFLDVLMDFVPELVVSGFQAPCLLHFCDLLSQAHRGRNIKAQSVASLLKVVNALNSYLRRAYSGSTATTSAPSSSDPSGSQATATQQQQPPKASTSQQQQQQQQVQQPSTLSDTAPPDGVLLRDRINWPSRPTSSSLAGGPSYPQLPICATLGLGATSQSTTAKPTAPTAPTSSSKQSRSNPASFPSASSNGPSSLAAMSAAAASDAPALGRRLVALLFDCWAECGPSKAVEGPEVEPLQVLSGILSAVVTLVNALLLPAATGSADADQHAAATKAAADKAGLGGDPMSLDFFTDEGASSSASAASSAAVLEWLGELALRRVPPAFPAHAPSVRPSAALVDALVAFNLQASQLLAMMLPTTAAVSPSGGDAPWVQALIGFYVGVLERGEVVPARGLLSEASSVAGAATNAAYLAVLRGVGAAVRAASSSGGDACSPAAEQLMRSVEALAARMSARSPVRAACLRLQHALLRGARRGRGAAAVPDGAAARWLAPLPRLLWELGDATPAASELALRMLHDAARFAPPEAATAAAAAAPGRGAALRELQPQLAPLFCVHMPASRKQAAQQAQQAQQALLLQAGAAACPSCAAQRADAEARVVQARAAASGSGAGPGDAPTVLTPGPLSKLPLDVQLLAVDLVYHLGRLEAPLLKALGPAVHSPRVLPSASAALRLAELTLARLPDMEPATAASWALTLLFSPSGPAAAAAAAVGDVAVAGEALWERQRAVVDRVCGALPAWAPVRTALYLMERQLDVLLAGGTAPLGDQQRYALLRVATAALTEAAAAGEGTFVAGAGGTAGAVGVLPASVQAALPAACVDFYRSRMTQGQGQQQQGGGAGPLVFTQAAAAGAAAAAAAATVLQLLAAAPDLLLPPLLQHCSSSESHHLHERKKQKGQQGAVEAKACSTACARASFLARASLLQHVLRCRALAPALLRLRPAARRAAAALAARAAQSAQLSGDAECRAEGKQLEQVALDVLGEGQ